MKQETTLSRNLKLYRNWRGRSIEETAKLLDLSPTKYKNYETGVWQVPEEIVERACNLYKVSPKTLCRIEVR